MSSTLPASPALCRIAHSRAHGDLDNAKQGGHEWPGWAPSWRVTYSQNTPRHPKFWGLLPPPSRLLLCLLLHPKLAFLETELKLTQQACSLGELGDQQMSKCFLRISKRQIMKPYEPSGMAGSVPPLVPPQRTIENMSNVAGII